MQLGSWPASRASVSLLPNDSARRPFGPTSHRLCSRPTACSPLNLRPHSPALTSGEHLVSPLQHKSPQRPLVVPSGQLRVALLRSARGLSASRRCVATLTYVRAKSKPRSPRLVGPYGPTSHRGGSAWRRGPSGPLAIASHSHRPHTFAIMTHTATARRPLRANIASLLLRSASQPDGCSAIAPLPSNSPAAANALRNARCPFGPTSRPSRFARLAALRPLARASQSDSRSVLTSNYFADCSSALRANIASPVAWLAAFRPLAIAPSSPPAAHTGPPVLQCGSPLDRASVLPRKRLEKRPHSLAVMSQ